MLYPGLCGYGSIPISTIFSGMNIHKSQQFRGSLGARVLTHCHVSLLWNMYPQHGHHRTIWAILETVEKGGSPSDMMHFEAPRKMIFMEPDDLERLGFM